MFNAEFVEPGNEFEYMLLGRLKADCEYYLGNGNGHKKHLWADDEAEQIKEMKRLWNNLPEKEKPDWLSMEDILNYEHKMTQQ